MPITWPRRSLSVVASDLASSGHRLAPAGAFA